MKKAKNLQKVKNFILCAWFYTHFYDTTSLSPLRNHHPSRRHAGKRIRTLYHPELEWLWKIRTSWTRENPPQYHYWDHYSVCRDIDRRIFYRINFLAKTPLFRGKPYYESELERTPQKRSPFCTHHCWTLFVPPHLSIYIWRWYFSVSTRLKYQYRYHIDCSDDPESSRLYER